MKFAVEMLPNDQQPSGLRSPAGAEANFMEVIRILDPNRFFPGKIKVMKQHLVLNYHPYQD